MLKGRVFVHKFQSTILLLYLLFSLSGCDKKKYTLSILFNYDLIDTESTVELMLLRSFEQENPNIILDTKFVDADFYDDYFKVITASQQLQDVFMLGPHSTFLPSLIKNDTLHDMAPWFSEAEKKHYVDELWVHHNGALYVASPTMTMGPFLIINDSLVSKEDRELLKDSSTIEKVVRKLAKEHQIPVAVTKYIKSNDYIAFLISILEVSYGDDWPNIILSDQYDVSDILSHFLQWIGYFQLYINKNYEKSTFQNSVDRYSYGFLNSHVPMVIANTRILSFQKQIFGDSSPFSRSFGLLPVESADGSRRASKLYTRLDDGYSVKKQEDSSKMYMAKTFVRFMMSGEAAIERSKAEKPVTYHLRNENSLWAKLLPYATPMPLFLDKALAKDLDQELYNLNYNPSDTSRLSKVVKNLLVAMAKAAQEQK